MTLIHIRGGNWPGFRYNDEEKAQLQAIADRSDSIEYFIWAALFAVFFIMIIISTVAEMSCVTFVIGGEQNMSTALFALTMVLVIVVSFTMGLPAAMLPAAALVGRWCGVADADLPDHATTAHYYYKLWFQVTRVAIISLIILVPLWIFVPSDSKILVIGQLVLPLLSPAVGAITTSYYFSTRLRQSNQNSRDSTS